MKVYIETYGCTANQSDSAGIREAVLEAGGTVTGDAADADVVVINTCAVTAYTSRSMLRAIRRHEGRRVIVAGCMAADQPGLLIGHEHASAPGAAAALEALGLRSSGRIPLAMAGRTASISIAEGCRGQCSYCIVRLARGGLRSRPPGEVAEAARRAIAAGAAEIFLTAQDTGAYGLDIGERLPGLIRAVAGVPGDFKVRVGMMNPFSIGDILPDLADALCLPRVYRFAHVPAQSGSDRVLQLMGRPYTAAGYSELVSGLRDRVPGIVFSTDYIVGFPTETDGDFGLTMDALRRDRPLKVNITRFSPRPGTVAAAMPDVPGRVKKARSRALTALHHEVTSAHMRSAIGCRASVLVTEKGKPGTVVARDGSYNMVVINEDLPPGESLEVELYGAGTTYMIGRRLTH